MPNAVAALKADDARLAKEKEANVKMAQLYLQFRHHHHHHHHHHHRFYNYVPRGYYHHHHHHGGFGIYIR